MKEKITSLEMIKSKVERLYKTNPKIHMNVAIANPRLNLTNEPVEIKGVYPHVFRIEETGKGFPKYHTVQYKDILLRHVEIVEFENL